MASRGGWPGGAVAGCGAGDGRGGAGRGASVARYCAGGIEVRDSKAGESGPILRFTPAEFDAFLDGARKGEFDHLLG